LLEVVYNKNSWKLQQKSQTITTKEHVFVAMKNYLRNNKFPTSLVTIKIANYFNKSYRRLQQNK
jgi:hypothetical protein